MFTKKIWFRPTLESEFNTNRFTGSDYEVAVQSHCFAIMVLFYTLCTKIVINLLFND